MVFLRFFENFTNTLKLSWIIEWIFIMQVFPCCFGNSCPSNVQREAFSCFSGYSTQLLNMQKSTETLFTGVDVELLRAFCSSYVQSMNCIEDLKVSCPLNLHTKIDITLINFDGAKDELEELCRDDALYEVYARHMTCFLNYGSYSERCFEDTMNTTVRLMKRIDDKSLPQLCGDFRKVLNCIRSNIERSCGQEAANLVPVLVKPMVRRSNLCDLNSDDRKEPTTTTMTQTTTEDTIITDSLHRSIKVRNKNVDSGNNSVLDTSGSKTLVTILVIISAIIY